MRLLSPAFIVRIAAIAYPCLHYKIISHSGGQSIFKRTVAVMPKRDVNILLHHANPGTGRSKTSSVQTSSSVAGIYLEGVK
jgi:hypothetical protein